VTTFAGSSSTGIADGPALSATFNNPYGVAVDTSGIVFVSCRTGLSIRMISSGNVFTIAGRSSTGYSNGFGTNALFTAPTHIALSTDSKLYVSDYGSHQIRLVNMAGACGQWLL
jgi:hypothetical protein